MFVKMLRNALTLVALALTTIPMAAAGDEVSLVVAIPEQKLFIIKNGRIKSSYPVSTSKFGLGDRPRSYATPLGALQITEKIGENVRPGTVFKGRSPTGEILRPNVPGRDPIVTRILRLRGLERQNRNAYARCVYIHGTTAERFIGQPASYGCVRMRSKDIVKVFKNVPIGTVVEIVNTPIRIATQRLATR